MIVFCHVDDDCVNTECLIPRGYSFSKSVDQPNKSLQEINFGLAEVAPVIIRKKLKMNIRE